ncbi:MAG: ABC transporter substrate-binding protein [Desulfosarcinaceae bacterium]|nr:ABC transporter substrate-binding protein [Desulfosarcinaceae bacterium]
MDQTVTSRWTRRLLLGGCLLLLLACGGGEPAAPPTLQVGLENAPKTLDPRFATDAAGMRITQHLLFETLVQLGPDLTIAPALAERWEVNDPTTYTFHLMPKARFHDDRPLTAADVVFTFEHLMAEETKSPFGPGYRNKIKAIEAVDDHTVRFTLHQPTASFLTSVIIPILPKHVLTAEGDFGAQPVGSGPFAFVSQSPTEIVVAAYKAYAAGAPKVDRVVFKVIKDDNTRFLKLQKGELDLLINALPPNRVAALREAPLKETYAVIESPGIAYSYLGFNLAAPEVQDLRVRQAIAHAIDVNEIIRFRLENHAVPATGLLSPVNWYHSVPGQTYSHDPTKAIALLEAANYRDPDGEGPKARIHLELKTSNNAQVTGIARILQAQLAKVGIDLKLKSYEWGTFYGDIKSGNFQLTSMRWVGVTEPDFFYDLFHSSQIPPAGRNRGRYTNPEMDRLVTEGRLTTDPDARKRIYAEVQDLVARELPYISLWHPNNISVVHRRVQGYEQHPMAGYSSFRMVSLAPAE